MIWGGDHNGEDYGSEEYDIVTNLSCPKCQCICPCIPSTKRMSCLIANLPSYEVWVRKEYLTDHKSGHGEFVKGVWVSAKSIPGRAFYFETYLPEYAAMFDKLPISAFTSDPETPKPDMTLHNLQFWNCMDYGVVAVQKQFIGSMHYEVYTRDYGTQTGTYICTLDNYHSDVDAIDYSTSEQPAEHKSHNLLRTG